MDKNIEESFSFNQIELSDENYENLYHSGDFDTWFFEYDDDPEINKLIHFVIDNFESKNKNFIRQIDKQVEPATKNLANKNWQTSLYLRLLDCAYLYSLNKNEKLRDISATIAHKIKTSALSDFSKIKFIKDLTRRSILQFVGNCLEEEEEEKKVKKTRFTTVKPEKTKPTLDFDKAISLLNYLEGYWK
jgi:hypothetical protein